MGHGTWVFIYVKNNYQFMILFNVLCFNLIFNNIEQSRKQGAKFI